MISNELHQIIHLDLGTTYYKMNFSRNIKKIDKKIQQNKLQYNLNRETAKISALSSGSVGEYEFSARVEILSEEGLLEKLQQSKELNIRH